MKVILAIVAIIAVILVSVVEGVKEHDSQHMGGRMGNSHTSSDSSSSLLRVGARQQSLNRFTNWLKDKIHNQQGADDQHSITQGHGGDPAVQYVVNAAVQCLLHSWKNVEEYESELCSRMQSIGNGIASCSQMFSGFAGYIETAFCEEIPKVSTGCSLNLPFCTA